jgi:hypothetical protein
MQSKEAVYEANINARYNNLQASIVEAVGDDTDIGSAIEIITAKNGALTFKVKGNEAGSILAHSMFDPQKEAEKMIENLDFSRHTLILVFGLGLGYHIERVLERATTLSRVIIIEPDKNVYENFMKNKDMKKIFNDNRVLLVIGIDKNNIQSVLTGFSSAYIFNLGHNIQYVALKYYNLFYNNISDIINKISNIVQYSWKGLGNCHTDHNIGVIQTILNMEDIIDNIDVGRLKNVYEGRAAIIVSAGPSLNKNIHHLKKAKGKALIIAVDSALDRLLTNGIVPDVVATLERIGIYSVVLNKMKNTLPKEVVLLAPTLAEIDTVKFFNNNNKIFFFQSGVGTQDYFAKILKAETMWNGTSAALTALSFTQVIGIKAVAFAGQDLAYGENGDIYCEGVSKDVDDKEQELRSSNGYLVTVKDYEGRDIPSNVLWKDQLLGFNYFILAHSGSMKFFDATEGGAKKEGAINITLEAFVSEYCTQDIDDINKVIEKKKQKITQARKKKIINRLLGKLKDDYEIYKEIQTKLQDKVSRLEAFPKYQLEDKQEIPDDKVDEMLKEIKDTDDIINTIREHKFLNLYYQGLIMAFITEIHEVTQDDFIINVIKNIKIQYNYLKLITDVFNVNLGCLAYGIKFLEAQQSKTAMTDNIMDILKEVLESNGINPEYIDEYYKNINEG